MKTSYNLVKVILFCIVFPGILARFQYDAGRQFQRFPTNQRLQRRLEPPTRLTSRPFIPRQRIRSLPRLLQPRGILNPRPSGLMSHRQDMYPTAPKWFNRSPFLSEVSVPSVRRTPVPKRDTLRQLRGDLPRENISVIGVNDRPERQGSVLPRVRQKIVPSKVLNKHSFEQNGLNFSQNTRKNTLNIPRIIYGPVQTLIKQPSIVRARYHPSRQGKVLPIKNNIEKHQALPKVVSRKRVTPFHQNPVLVRPIPYKTQNLRVPSQPLVSLRSLPGINTVATDPRQPLVIQTKPTHGARLNFASSDSDSTSISFKTHVSGKSDPMTILHTQPKFVRQGSNRVAGLQTITATSTKTDPVSVIHANPSTNVIQTIPLVRPIQTNQDNKLSTSHQKQITQSNSNIAPMQPNPVSTVVQSNTGFNIGMMQPDVHIANVQERNNMLSPGTIHSPIIGSTIQTNTAQPVSTLHSDLVDAFTNVIESLLVPQISGGQTGLFGKDFTNNNIKNANEPLGQHIANAHLPQQVVLTSPHTSSISQFTPHHMQGSPMMGGPYNQFGYMQNFGYVNPWMSSAAMQEMMFGDTTDPPDIITTTSLPTNVSAANSTINENATAIALDSNITLPIANQISINTEVKIGTGMGNVLVTTKEPLIKAKDIPVNIDASMDITANTENLSQDNTIQHFEKKVISTVDLLAENGTIANKMVEHVQNIVADSGLVNIDANIELQPTSIIKTKPDSDAMINPIADTNAIDTAKVEPGLSTMKVKAKGTIEVLSNPIYNDKKESKETVSKMNALNTDIKIEQGVKTVEKGVNDNIIELPLPTVPNKVRLNANSKKKIFNAALKTKKGDPYARPPTKKDNKLDKNEKLILDIASLIRNSKLDLGKLSSIVSTNSEKIEKVNMKPIPERYPTAKQLGIKLSQPAKRKRPKNKIRPTKSLTKYTLTPLKTPTVPPVSKAEVVINSTIPTLIPKGLVFTRQPEIYRTLRTMLKHNPDAVKKAITTDPTPTYGLTKATKGPGIKNLVDNSKDGSSPALVSILTKLTKTSTVKATKPTSEVPVLSNVVDHKVEQKLIADETIVTEKLEKVNKEKTVSDTGNVLHQQLLDLKVTKDDADMAKYLNDPDFVNLLRGILKNMASKPEGTTSEYYYHEPETTTYYPEITTTSWTPTTTEEYEAEDYITEAP